MIIRQMLRKIALDYWHKLYPRHYHRIVSIGSNCEVTWNIRNHFHVDMAYPFDWWITPVNALIQILDERFDGLFEAQNIYVPPDRKTVVDQRYNLLYHHDFQRDADDLIVLDDIEKQLPELRNKYESLSNRFINDLKGKNILFVRNRWANEPGYQVEDHRDIQPEQCIEICKKLSTLMPDTRFDLFATNEPDFESFQFGGTEIFCDRITEHKDCDDFRVSPKGWAEMFRRNNIKIRRR